MVIGFIETCPPGSNRINELVNLKGLTTILDVMAPMKTVQIRKHGNNWISEETLCMMKQRDYFQKTASETNCKNTWKQYKLLRNKINNKLKFEEKMYQKRKLQQCNGNSLRSWKTMNNILNWHSSGAPNRLFYNGKLITKSQEIGDCQNDFFINKINEIKEELPSSGRDPLKTLKSVMKNRKCTMKLSSVHPDEVLKIISSNSPSFGFDRIDTYIIKLVKN